MRKIIPCLKNVFRWFVPAILSLVFASVEASAQTDDEMYVTIHMKNQPLAVLLDEIGRQCGCSFILRDNDVKQDLRLTVDAENERLDQVLEKMLKGTGLRHQIIDGRKISIFRPEDKTPRTRMVRGLVTDESGCPLVGAVVFFPQNPSLGRETDLDGKFEIAIPQGIDHLTISLIGFGSENIFLPANISEPLSIVLKEDVQMLDDVVVVGYGIQRKSVVTAAISSVKGDALTQTAGTRVDNLLKGMVSGVTITQNSGQPGSGTKVRIRGIGTINDSNPLYIVDGMPVSGSIDYLNPADIIYRKNELTVDMLNFSHGDQHIIINGKATPQATDSIVADLKDVDVAYILNLVNFHSVDFAGKASGKAVVKSIFQTPEAYANLDVKDFVFENGPLGTLHAKAAYDNQEGQINIDATAEDGPEHLTVINGYVSPKRNYIDLGIEAHNTSLKFMENFCGSFLNNVEAWCKGKLNVVGDLKNINLVGDVVAHGRMHMKQLGTDYTFNHLRAHAIPDDIQFEGDSIYDSHYNGKHSHFALIRGGIHHKHLTRLSYDLDIDANNFLGFDTHEFGDDTFYGTVFATGTVGIHGKSGETIIDIDATPEPHSIFVYNVASPDAISAGSFIHWNDATPYIYRPYSPDNDKDKKKDSSSNFSSDMRINFLVNTNPNLTLKLMMDDQTGDYITLNGNGVIRANYYNKGGLDMFGNYVVDHGQYKLTIQNIIKKDFDFQPGGTIAFGGDPYNAPLNLQAKYTVNGVPLSDLNIGRSFSSNNIRVDCLMDITGTPGAPKVDFSMDLPTVNSDAKQMIYSVINSQEEMNQQVLYLLGIGRFYTQTKNNQTSEDASQQSQTSLAMQSLLSGTISQQINNVLSSFVNSSNWNFGANISTGNEGFNNAEYEGILSGRLLNNRLLFNGQFGYRDNANATQSFIGDFDLRYLIFPNGNLSIHVYNQTNDRYFTRNSLNTQGVGLIMKKDFFNLRDLLGIKKKSKDKEKEDKNKKKGKK